MAYNPAPGVCRLRMVFPFENMEIGPYSTKMVLVSTSQDGRLDGDGVMSNWLPRGFFRQNCPDLFFGVSEDHRLKVIIFGRMWGEKMFLRSRAIGVAVASCGIWQSCWYVAIVGGRNVMLDKLGGCDGIAARL